MEPKGKKLLKIVGILFIIGGIISLLISIMGLAGGGLLMGFSEESGDPGIAKMLGSGLIVAFIIALITSVLWLLAGICGVRNCRNVNAAPLCLHYGRLTLILAVASILINFVLGVYSDTGIVSTILSILFSLLLPILYTIGAMQNKHELSKTEKAGLKKQD